MKHVNLSEVLGSPSWGVYQCYNLLHQQVHREGCRGLIVGCGNGEEAVHLQKMLGCFIVGLDIIFNFSRFFLREGTPIIGDAKSLPFSDNSFDFIIAIHSLEHVGNPSLAVSEIRRTMCSGGYFYVGVPNKSRIIGYLGSHDATLKQKITWNFQDLLAKWKGRFENELGAHAGFTQDELVSLLQNQFIETKFLTKEYFINKYSGRIPAKILDYFLSLDISDKIIPSIYAICRKE